MNSNLRIKKSLSFLCALCLVSGAFIGCGTPDENSNSGSKEVNAVIGLSSMLNNFQNLHDYTATVNMKSEVYYYDENPMFTDYTFTVVEKGDSAYLKDLSFSETSELLDAPVSFKTDSYMIVLKDKVYVNSDALYNSVLSSYVDLLTANNDDSAETQMVKKLQDALQSKTSGSWIELTFDSAALQQSEAEKAIADQLEKCTVNFILANESAVSPIENGYEVSISEPEDLLPYFDYLITKTTEFKSDYFDKVHAVVEEEQKVVTKVEESEVALRKFLEDLFREADVTYTAEDLDTIVDKLKESVDSYEDMSGVDIDSAADDLTQETWDDAFDKVLTELKDMKAEVEKVCSTDSAETTAVTESLDVPAKEDVTKSEGNDTDASSDFEYALTLTFVEKDGKYTETCDVSIPATDYLVLSSYEDGTVDSSAEKKSSHFIMTLEFDTNSVPDISEPSDKLSTAGYLGRIINGLVTFDDPYYVENYNFFEEFKNPETGKLDLSTIITYYTTGFTSGYDYSDYAFDDIDWESYADVVNSEDFSDFDFTAENM